ncbi:MAG: 3-phosphoshikimate 1-carboxyvinyltransferase [Candidatus Bathyarchaeia archaeon]
MTDLIVKRTESLAGMVTAPPSKAHTHRAFIAATLSEGQSTIRNPLICDDTLATINACRMLGANISKHGDHFEVNGVPKPNTPENVIDCGGSGATIRFLTPICALADGISVLTGNESLRKRPMQPLLDALEQLEVRCYSARLDGFPPVIVFGGGIKGGKAAIRGDISSQFISGLLLATPLAENETELVVTTRLESKPYVDITVDVLLKHGVKVDFQSNHERFNIPPMQEYTPFDHVIEGDYSSAAFLLAAAALTNSNVKVKGLRKETLQGDRVIVDILKEMGTQIEVHGDLVQIRGAAQNLNGIEVDLRDNPDLVPVCAALASLSRGRTVIAGVKRLRFKESDRVSSLSTELAKMGVNITALDDRLVIEGRESLKGAEIDSHNDHRIAMACTILALRAEGETVIHGIECISKSYPNFIRDLLSLGGEVVER